MPEGSYPAYEIEEGPGISPRLDAPIQLEVRGTTSQETALPEGYNGRIHQMLLWSKHTTHKNSAAAKLRSVGRTVEAEKLEKCHTVFTVAQCSKCRKVQKFPNRCDLFYCAECQPRLSSDRRRAVEWWTKEISQPKHVVLTLKNTPELTSGHVRELIKWFGSLRRRKFARFWLGGFYRIEVTHEQHDWHLHLHALINAHWIDAIDLSRVWQEVTRGFGRIVKVKDCRQKTYLNEVTKYVVTGGQIAAWDAADIATFIDAFDGVRTFGVFGDLYGKRTAFAEWFKAIRDARPGCPCGCNELHYFTEAQFLEKDFVAVGNTETIPPPKLPDLNITFGFEKRIEFGPR
jgi:predicted nucleic acid binding AN1-type Zn finger protein